MALLEVQNLHVSYGSIRALHGISFRVERGEVVTLIGSKEGIAHLPLAFINPGDLALVPSPAILNVPRCCSAPPAAG